MNGKIAGTKLKWGVGTYLLIGLALAIVFLIYCWYISVGYWTAWPKSTYAYDLLASSFQQGQVSLQDTPDPALLVLPDPYNPASRSEIPFIWDASLFNGKYYLYFGPVPALLLVVVKFFVSRQIPDQYLVFTFTCGLFVFLSLLMISFWGRFFRQLPIWTLLLALFIGGLVSPTIWLLSRPAVYEAAIASCQFFFIGGFYFAYSAINIEHRPIRPLILAGILWAFAIGSRTTIVIAIGFILLMVAWWIKTTRQPEQTLRRSAWNFAAIALPVILGITALGWYNWTRFGSVLEFGLRYQLTWINLQTFYNQEFSPTYLLQNLHAYLWMAPDFTRTFPILKAQVALNPAVAQLMPTVVYHPEAVTGLLYAAPFLVMALFTIAYLYPGDIRGLSNNDSKLVNREKRTLLWVSLTLLGSAFLSFILLLLFFYATMRYLEDVVPSLVLLSSLGFWQGYSFIRQQPWLRILFTCTSIGLAGYSVGVSLLLAITGYEERFKHLNHALLNQLIRFFGH